MVTSNLHWSYSLMLLPRNSLGMPRPIPTIEEFHYIAYPARMFLSYLSILTPDVLPLYAILWMSLYPIPRWTRKTFRGFGDAKKRKGIRFLVVSARQDESWLRYVSFRFSQTRIDYLSVNLIGVNEIRPESDGIRLDPSSLLHRYLYQGAKFKNQ